MKYFLCCDLKDDQKTITTYKNYHQVGKTWPAIIQSIRDAGVENMEIYNTGNRLFMVMEVGPEFSFAKKARMDQNNPQVGEWEKLMWNFQQALPWAKEGEKWVLMDKIFDLSEHPGEK